MSHKKHLKQFSREVPLFDVGRVEFHKTKESMAVGMSKVEGLDEEDKDLSGCSGCAVYGGYDKGGWVWFLGVFDGKPDTVAHEAFHVTVRILSCVGVPIQKDAANETAAYLIGWLVRQFNEIYEKSQEN